MRTWGEHYLVDLTPVSGLAFVESGPDEGQDFVELLAMRARAGKGHSCSDAGNKERMRRTSCAFCATNRVECARSVGLGEARETHPCAISCINVDDAPLFAHHQRARAPAAPPSNVLTKNHHSSLPVLWPPSR